MVLYFVVFRRISSYFVGVRIARFVVMCVVIVFWFVCVFVLCKYVVCCVIVVDVVCLFVDIECVWVCLFYDLSFCWLFINEFCVLEIVCVEFDFVCFCVGWYKCKSYVGIIYLYDDECDGGECGDVFLFKYVMLDSAFENVVGCVRYEFVYVVVGVVGVDYGRVFKDVCDVLDVLEVWCKVMMGVFYSRSSV